MVNYIFFLFSGPTKKMQEETMSTIGTPEVQHKNIIKVLDPRMQFQQGRNFLALRGASIINAAQYQQSSVSNSSVTITCNPPKSLVAMCKEVLLHMTFSITVTGTNTTSPATALLTSGYYGPRAYPLSAIISSETMNINNDSYTIQGGNLFWKALLRMKGDYIDRERDYSTAPSMMDNSGQYLDDSSATTSVKNPLGSWDSSYEDTRTSFSGFTVVSNSPSTPTTASLTLDCVEPIRISPLAFGNHAYGDSALIGVSNMLYTASLQNLNRVMSFAKLDAISNIALTSVVVNVTSAELMFLYLTPNPEIPIPASITLPYANVVDYPTVINQSLTNGSSATITLNNIQLNSIPRKIVMFAPVQPDSVSQTTDISACVVPDTFLSIYNVANPDAHPMQITFDNQALFGGHTAYDIYKMCQKNGLSLSWDEWATMPSNYVSGHHGSTGVGSVVVMNFGEDIPLQKDVAVGCTGSYQFSATFTVVNTTGKTLPAVQFHMVAIYDGSSLTTSNGFTTHTNGDLTMQEVAAVPLNPEIGYTEFPSVLGGGDFWGSIKNIVGKIGSFLKNNKVISTIAPMLGNLLTPLLGPAAPVAANQIGQVAQRMGFGNGGYRRRPLRQRIQGGLLRGGSIEDLEEEEDNVQ